MNTNTFIQQEGQSCSSDRSQSKEQLGYSYSEKPEVEIKYFKTKPPMIEKEEREEAPTMTKSQKKRYYKELGLYK